MLCVSGENYLVTPSLLATKIVNLSQTTFFSLFCNSEGTMPLMNFYLLDILPILIIIMGILLVVQFLYFFVIKKRLRKNSEEEVSDKKDTAD